MFELSIEGRTRKDILDAALSVGKTGAHIAPSLSLVEIVLSVLENFTEKDDTFILSKGHGALGYYAALHQMGFISDEQFFSFETDGGEFPGQPSRTAANHIDYSSGSLGMGLSYGIGTAVASPTGKTYVILGDGEINEGSVWEAASLAAKWHLKNLIAVVDQNGFQSDGKCDQIMDMDLAKIWDAYGWNVLECDGHSLISLRECLNAADSFQPTVILAHTKKGKGVSFMENNNEWHHRELTQKDYDSALIELGGKYGCS